MTVTDTQIRNYLERRGVVPWGIWLRDQVPTKEPPSPGLYIFNLDGGDAATGTHWTCMIASESDCVYFDSFGCPPPVQVDNFAKKKYPKRFHNRLVLQDVDSTTCGLYVIAFALSVLKDEPKLGLKAACLEFIKVFSTQNKKANDKFIQKRIQIDN